jgi:hypothetical protein
LLLVLVSLPEGSLGCWSHLDPITSRLKGVGVGTYAPNGQYSLKDVVYQDAGIYKCVGQSPTNKKKLEVLNTIALGVKGKMDSTLHSRSLNRSVAQLFPVPTFQQVNRRSQQGTKRHPPSPVCRSTCSSSSVQIRQRPLHDGFTAIAFTRLAISMEPMSWLMA